MRSFDNLNSFFSTTTSLRSELVWSGEKRGGEVLFRLLDYYMEETFLGRFSGLIVVPLKAFCLITPIQDFCWAVLEIDGWIASSNRFCLTMFTISIIQDPLIWGFWLCFCGTSTSPCWDTLWFDIFGLLHHWQQFEQIRINGVFGRVILCNSSIATLYLNDWSQSMYNWLIDWLALPVGNEGPSTFTGWYIGDETSLIPYG